MGFLYNVVLSVFGQNGSKMVQNWSGMVPNTSGTLLGHFWYKSVFQKNSKQIMKRRHVSKPVFSNMFYLVGLVLEVLAIFFRIK